MALTFLPCMVSVMSNRNRSTVHFKGPCQTIFLFTSLNLHLFHLFWNSALDFGTFQWAAIFSSFQLRAFLPFMECRGHRQMQISIATNTSIYLQVIGIHQNQCFWNLFKTLKVQHSNNNNNNNYNHK